MFHARMPVYYYFFHWWFAPRDDMSSAPARCLKMSLMLCVQKDKRKERVFQCWECYAHARCDALLRLDAGARTACSTTPRFWGDMPEIGASQEARTPKMTRDARRASAREKRYTRCSRRDLRRLYLRARWKDMSLSSAPPLPKRAHAIIFISSCLQEDAAPRCAMRLFCALCSPRSACLSGEAHAHDARSIRDMRRRSSVRDGKENAACEDEAKNNAYGLLSICHAISPAMSPDIFRADALLRYAVRSLSCLLVSLCCLR